MRKVEICSDGWFGGRGRSEPHGFRPGSFHGFFSAGSNEDGIECYGLVELSSGVLEMVPTRNMKFLDDPIEKKSCALYVDYEKSCKALSDRRKELDINKDKG